MFANWWTLSNVASLISIVSFIVTVIGFGIGLKRLWAIKEETERIRKEHANVQRRIDIQAVVEDLTTLALFLKNVADQAENKNWDKVKEYCYEIVQRAARCKASELLIEAEKDTLNSIAETIRTNAVSLQELLLPPRANMTEIATHCEWIKDVLPEIQKISEIVGELRERGKVEG